MATNSKKVETRLDLETYKLLEKAADRCGASSVYTMLQYLVRRGLSDFGYAETAHSKDCREVITEITREEYGILKVLSLEYECSVMKVANTCLLAGLKKLVEYHTKNKPYDK